MDKLKYWFRWIGVLPISVLAGVLVTFPLHFALYQTLSGGQNPLITPYPELPEKLLMPFFVGLVTVYVASMVAPQYKYRVSMIIALVWLLGAGASMAMGYFSVNSENIQYNLIGGGLPVLLGIAGSFAGLYLVKKKQEESKIYNY